jgi:hypothetical protein
LDFQTGHLKLDEIRIIWESPQTLQFINKSELYFNFVESLKQVKISAKEKQFLQAEFSLYQGSETQMPDSEKTMERSPGLDESRTMTLSANKTIWTNCNSPPAHCSHVSEAQCCSIFQEQKIQIFM